MNSFTPAPWIVSEDDSNGQAIVRGEHIEIATCWHHSVGSIEKEMRSNARLIAAAPDLLAALRLAEDALSRSPFSTQLWWNGDHPEAGIQIIRAAIAKAVS